MRRAKIVCTIGPASSKRGVMEKMLRAGMDVARLNFSHGTHEEHAVNIANLRDVAEKMGRPLALLQDLSGPKVRLGDFGEPITLKRGQTIGFTADAAKEIDRACPILPLPVPELIAVLKPNQTLLLDDGKIALRVVKVEEEPGNPARIVWAKCVAGGELKTHKGVTAPGVRFQVPAVTEKDKDDLRFGLAQGIDWVAASYVRSAEDLQPLRDVMAEVGIYAPIIAKIEKFEAVRNLESIIDAVDGIMVARGDLGVEMPFDEVPLVQKQIIRLCNRRGKPVITATQMLESMLTCPRPTRAEAADVANAILDGTDAVMLSGETAAGDFPVEAVQTMARIAERADDALHQVTDYNSRLDPPVTVTDAVARATAEIARQVKAAAIVCATRNGGTARAVAQNRPNTRILAVTTERATYRRLALTWGVTPALITAVDDTDALLDACISAALKTKVAKLNDRLVLTSGVPVNSPGTTNLIKVHTVT